MNNVEEYYELFDCFNFYFELFKYKCSIIDEDD